MALNLYVPVGSSPDIGRKRPSTIGDSAVVEMAQSMYPYSIPHHAKPWGRAGASRIVSAPCDPSAPRRSPRMLLASSAEVLWRGAEAAEVADALIKAYIGM